MPVNLTDVLDGEDAPTVKSLAHEQIISDETLIKTYAQEQGIADDYGIIFGSNANGDYVKYPDGTMICHIRNKVTTFGNTANLQFTWTYPVAFIELPTVQSSCDLGAFSLKFRATPLIVYARTPTPTNVIIGFASNAAWIDGDQSLGDNISAVAIGLWK